MLRRGEFQILKQGIDRNSCRLFPVWTSGAGTGSEIHFGRRRALKRTGDRNNEQVLILKTSQVFCLPRANTVETRHRAEDTAVLWYFLHQVRKMEPKLTLPRGGIAVENI